MERKRHQLWLAQAENDLAWGWDSLEHGYFAQSCFIAQQVAEKALISVAYFRGNDIAKSHSILKLSQALGINSEIEDAARVLDQYYQSARYPDALPEDLLPSEFFSKKLANEALTFASMIIQKVKIELDGGDPVE